MSGSIYYDPQYPNNCPVVYGARIAFRLGRVAESTIENNITTYRDVQKDAEYGYLTITSVDAQSLAFEYVLYDLEGNTIRSGDCTLRLNENADLNGDDAPDISWTLPSIIRPGLEQAVYLNFISSKTSLQTSMFSLIPEQYSRGLYPNGIIGINPNGKFIATKYSSSNGSRSITQGLLSGDFILDTINGQYFRVVGSGTRAMARSLTDSELEPLESSPPSYFFQEVDFSSGLSAINLLKAITNAVIGQESFNMDDVLAISTLNSLLERTDLIQALSSAQAIPPSQDELSTLGETIAALQSDELIRLNRLFLETCYPNLCPKISFIDDALMEVLPLLNCCIQNPECETEVEVSSNGQRALYQATSSSDYDNKRKEIEGSWGKYYKLVNFADWNTLTKIGEFFSTGTVNISDNSAGANSGASGDSATSKTPIFKPLTDFFVSTWEKIWDLVYTDPANVPPSQYGDLTVVKSNIEGKIDTIFNVPSVSKPLNIGLGIYGYFSSTWGNVEGGAAIAAFIQADTIFRATTSYNINPQLSGVLALQTNTDYLLNLPPFISIGPILVRTAVSGGIGLPISVNASAEMSSGYRYAFTGLYSVEAGVGANYGIVYKKVKILWWTIDVPSHPYFDLYTFGRPVSESVSYWGPTGAFITKANATVESSSASISITPTAYLEPRLLFNDCLYIGYRESVGREYKFAITSTNVPNRWYPDFHGIQTETWKAAVDVTAGVSFVVPIINMRINAKKSFNVWTSDIKPDTVIERF